MENNRSATIFKKQVGLKIKGIQLRDAIWILCSLAIGFLIGFSIPLSGLIFTVLKIAISLAIGLLLSVLCKSSHQHGDDKNYVLLLRWLIFIFSKRKIKKNDLKMSDYLNFSKIENEYLLKLEKQNFSSLMAGYELIGKNIFSNDDIVIENYVSSFSNLFKNMSETNLTLLKIDDKANFAKNINSLINILDKNEKLYVNKKINEEQYNARKYQIEGWMKQIESFENKTNDNESSEKIKRYFLIFYPKNIEGYHEASEKIEDKLKNINLVYRKCKYNEMLNFQNIIFKKEIIKASDIKEDEISNQFKYNEIEFGVSDFKIDGIHSNISSVNQYPPEGYYGWMVDLFNIEATVVMNFNNMAYTNYQKQISKFKNNLTSSITGDNKNPNKILELSKTNYDLQLLENLVTSLGSGEEEVKNISTYIITTADSKRELYKKTRSIRSELNEVNIKLDDLIFNQQQALSSISFKPGNELGNKTSRMASTYAIGRGYPFINQTINDEDGLYLGKSTTDFHVFYNNFHKQEKNRTNHNQVIMGKPGSGKSYLAKKEINWWVTNGHNVYVFDIESEYTDLVKYHNGNIIYLGDGINGRINPLQILNLIEINDEYNELKDNKVFKENIIPGYLNFLESFFKTLFTELTEQDISLLLFSIKEMYLNWKPFKAVYDNEKKIEEVNNDEFPIFDDLIKFIKKESAKKDNKVNLETYEKIIKILEINFSNDGILGSMYNGYTTIDLSNNFTVFNIKSLFEKNKKSLETVAMYLGFAYVQNQINKFRNENDNLFSEAFKKQNIKDKNLIWNNFQKSIVVIDEAHKLIDENNPVALDFIFQSVKRFRKYYSGIVLITQNPGDFTGSEYILKKTKAGIENTQSSFIFGLGSSDVKKVSELYSHNGGLTMKDQSYIGQSYQGKSLFILSSEESYRMSITVNKEEMEAFNNDKKW